MPTSDLLHRKDAVIDQLQAALQSSQRQVALLRGALRTQANGSRGHNGASEHGKESGSVGKLAQRGAVP